MSSSGEELLNDDTLSAFVVEPTLIAEEMHAGVLIASVYPLFPEHKLDHERNHHV